MTVIGMKCWLEYLLLLRSLLHFRGGTNSNMWTHSFNWHHSVLHPRWEEMERWLQVLSHRSLCFPSSCRWHFIYPGLYNMLKCVCFSRWKLCPHEVYIASYTLTCRCSKNLNLKISPGADVLRLGYCFLTYTFISLQIVDTNIRLLTF